MEIGPITFRDDILNGDAVFTNTKIPVRTLFNALDSGDSIIDFINDFPDVSKQQIEEVLAYAKRLITSSEVIKGNGALLDIVDNPFVPASDVIQLEKEISQLINEHRATLQLQPFSFNNSISEIARIHSMDMAKQTAPFDHEGFDIRVSLANEIVHGGGGAENLAAGFDKAEDVVQSWLNEPTHKTNVESALNFAGIGVAKFKGGKYFFTLLIV